MKSQKVTLSSSKQNFAIYMLLTGFLAGAVLLLMATQALAAPDD